MSETGPTVTDPATGEPIDGECAKHSGHWLAKAVRQNRTLAGLPPQECQCFAAGVEIRRPVVTRLLCRVLGHRWVPVQATACLVCTRCHVNGWRL